MKTNKTFWCALIALLSISSLVGCNNNNNGPEEDEDPIEFDPQEVGDTVNEWTCHRNANYVPLDFENDTIGSGELVDDQGQEDNESLYYVINASTESGARVLSSSNLETPYFNDDNAKNGDIISLYFLVPSDGNIKSVQFEVLSSNNASFKDDAVTIDDTHTDSWIRAMIVYNTLDTLASININITVDDQSQASCLYVDDINITLGEETVSNGYEYNNESLWETYEDYFKVGTAISAQMLRNTKMRQITKDNFNSVTAENEAKPEQILDQKECQELAKTDDTKVAITVKPFEKLYDFAEAHHIGVRHHTFVWYSQTPGWFFNEGYQQNGSQVSKDKMLKRMENFIKVTLDTINNRWPGLVYAVDVANEAIDNGIRRNNNNWYSTVGEDFVYYAFKYADMYKDPDQELYYNDYSYDYNTSNCEFALNTLLKKAIEENLVDGVGIQGHIDSDQNMDTMINNCKLIYDKGLKCQITELDITVNGTDENNLNKQKNAYKLLIKRVLQCNENQETDVNGIIVWGITDDTSWKRGQNPLLFNSSYAKKPAYYGFLEAIDEI